MDSFIPIGGSVVDEAIGFGLSKVTGKKVQIGSAGAYGRTPVSVYNDYKNMQYALDAYIEKGNIQPLRKEMVKWGMGFGKIFGASAVNRMIDNLIEEAKDSKNPFN
jgi:hypothetical protein